MSHVPASGDTWNMVPTVPPLSYSRQLRILRREIIYRETRMLPSSVVSVFPLQTARLVFINSVGIVVYLLRFY